MIQKFKKHLRACSLYLSILTHLYYLKLVVYHPTFRRILSSSLP